MKLKDWFSDGVDLADKSFDALRRRLKRRLSLDDPVQIVPYRGYGNAGMFFLSGRVLEDEGRAISSGDRETVWDNLLTTYWRFETDEVRGARVRARFGAYEQEELTDDDGYFLFRFAPGDALNPTKLWHEVELELLGGVAPEGEASITASGRVLVPPASARFAVISDIDDTVLWTNVKNRRNMARMTFLQSVRARLPFKGVAAFYRALQRGAGGDEGNPIFYVSSSPWNLYELLEEFLEINHIPSGPLLLKDIGKQTPFERGHQGHKLSKIEPLVRDFYPDLPFILIGDSGEQDPEIYSEVVRKFPERILAIYIRMVDADPARLQQVERLAEEVSRTRCQLIPAPDSLLAATHAAGQGWIAPDALAAIRDDKKADDEAPAVLAEDDQI